ncbi:MAG: hypothetical protein ACR2PG_06285 [Hyphomicrobiaceae bacterium]
MTESMESSLSDDELMSALFDKREPEGEGVGVPPDGEHGPTEPTEVNAQGSAEDPAASKEADASSSREAPGQPEVQLEVQPEAQTEGQPDPNAHRHVPLSELLTERRKFQERIDALEQQSDARDQHWRAQFDDLHRALRGNDQHHEHQQAPDILDDPEAAIRHMLAPIAMRLEDSRLYMSEERARESVGRDRVNDAWQAAKRAGLEHAFVNHPHPYGALLKWHQGERAIAMVGDDDPEGYRDRVKAEVRQEVVEELNAGKHASQSQNQQHFPSTLADQTQTGERADIQPTDEAGIDDVFHPDRHVRQRAAPR